MPVMEEALNTGQRPIRSFVLRQGVLPPHNGG